MHIEIGLHQFSCNPGRNYLRILCNTKYIVQVHFNITELVLCLHSVLIKDVITKQGSKALIFTTKINVFQVEKLRQIL